MLHLSLITRSAIALAVLSTACASRSVPAHYPAEAPSSSAAQTAKPALVAESLKADPGGRVEMDPSQAPQPQAPAAPSHEGHHGHH